MKKCLFWVLRYHRVSNRRLTEGNMIELWVVYSVDILLLGWLLLYWPHMAARLSTTLLPCGRAHMVETVSHILHSLYYPITTALH